MKTIKYLLSLNYDRVQNTKKKNWSVACCALVDSNYVGLDCSSMVLTTRPRRLVIYYQAIDYIIFI